MADSVEERYRLLRVSSVSFSMNCNGNKSMSQPQEARLHLLQSQLFFSPLKGKYLTAGRLALKTLLTIKPVIRAGSSVICGASLAVLKKKADMKLRRGKPHTHSSAAIFTCLVL